MSGGGVRKAIERAGPLVLVAGLAGALVAAVVPSPVAAGMAMAVAGALALVPVRGVSGAGIVYSLTGPLSGGTLVLMATGIATVILPEATVKAASGAVSLSVIVLIATVPLYTAVIAGFRIDPYRIGFGGWLLPALLGVALVAGFLAGAVAVAAWVVVGGALYLAGAYGSRNLIDYLVDPVATIFALVFLTEALLSP